MNLVHVRRVPCRITENLRSKLQTQCLAEIRNRLQRSLQYHEHADRAPRVRPRREASGPLPLRRPEGRKLSAEGGQGCAGRSSTRTATQRWQRIPAATHRRLEHSHAAGRRRAERNEWAQSSASPPVARRTVPVSRTASITNCAMRERCTSSAPSTRRAERACFSMSGRSVSVE